MDLSALTVEKGITNLIVSFTVNPPKKRKIKENYEELGGGLYNLRYQEEQNRKYIAAILLTLPSGEDLILDVGCGTGLFLSKLDSHIVGLDITSNLLRLAREKQKNNQHLVLGDAEQLPLRDYVFDNVYAITLIQNTPNKVKAVSEMKRVSKIHGKLLVTALKVVFPQDYLIDLFKTVDLKNINDVGGSGTNDWILYAEKG